MVRVLDYVAIALFNIWILGLVFPSPSLPQFALSPPIPASLSPLEPSLFITPAVPLQLTFSFPFPLPPTGIAKDKATPLPTELSLPSSTMTSSSASPLYSLPVTLVDSPRLHLTAWLKAINKHARTIEISLDHYGALYLVCTDTVWQALARNTIPPIPPNMGPPLLRPRGGCTVTLIKISVFP